MPSRRLGRSLGVDLVPYKTCTFDCVYCQLGRTSCLTRRREPHVAARTVLRELDDWISRGGTADVITLSGSGEPMLNSDIGEIVRRLAGRSSIPLALLTNGSLLADDEARRDVLGVDLLIPSLDAVSEEAFRRVNRPCEGIEAGQVIEGLVATRRDFGGPIWVEVMLVAGLNDSPEELSRIREALDRVHPDRVQINTVVRPPAEALARPLTREALQAARGALGPKAEVIAGVQASAAAELSGDLSERLIGLLRRRPCTLPDMASALAADPSEILKWLGQPPACDEVTTERREGALYYLARPTDTAT